MNLGSVIETLTDNGKRTIMAQRYIPDIVKGDKRILVIGGKPVPFSLARIPQNGEVRGNLAAGGIGVAQPLTARDREIADTLGADTGRPRPVAGRIRCYREFPYRSERHQPDLFPGNHPADRLPVAACSSTRSKRARR
jgi:hypothetical protein